MPRITATVIFDIISPQPFSDQGMSDILRGAIEHAKDSAFRAGTGSEGCARVEYSILSETIDSD